MQWWYSSWSIYKLSMITMQITYFQKHDLKVVGVAQSMHETKVSENKPSVNQSQYNIYSYIFCNLHPTNMLNMYKDMIFITTYIWYTISVYYIVHLSNLSLPGQPQKQQRSDRQGSKSRNASAGHSCAAAKVHRKRNSNAWKSCGENSGKFLVEKFLGNPLLTP